MVAKPFALTSFPYAAMNPLSIVTSGGLGDGGDGVEGTLGGGGGTPGGTGGVGGTLGGEGGVIGGAGGALGVVIAFASN